MKNELIPSAEYLKKAINILEINKGKIADSSKFSSQLILLKTNLVLNYTLQKKFSEALEISFPALEYAKKNK